MTTVPSFNPADFAAATNTDSTKLMDLVGFELFGAKCGLHAGTLSNGKKFFCHEWTNTIDPSKSYYLALMPTARLAKENRSELAGKFPNPANVIIGYTKGYELLTIPADKLPLLTTLPFQVEGYSDERGKRALNIVDPAAAIHF